MSRRSGWGTMAERINSTQHTPNTSPPPGVAASPSESGAESATHPDSAAQLAGAQPASTPPRSESSESPSLPPSATLKHCWVIDRHGRLPGLLLGWRRTAAGYQGRVVRAVLEGNTDWIVVEEWLPADQLERA
jgi:hypothetical protein